MKISPEVLDVLAMVECNANRAVIVEQLDRKLYTKTNDVLVALGGKWTRGAKAHIFDGPAQERIDQAILVGEVTTAKDLGFYPTPPALADRLVAMADIEPGHVCLEPSAGTGNIVKALFRAGATRVVAFERDLKMRHQLMRITSNPLHTLDVAPNDDFMEKSLSNIFLDVDRVVMNPPFYKVGFGDHLDHARLAYKLLFIRGVMVCVLPSSVLFRRDKRYAEFRAWALNEIGGTLEALPEGSFRESGTMVNTCVLRVEKRAA